MNLRRNFRINKLVYCLSAEKKNSTEYVTDNAPEMGNIAVLEWFKNSGFEFHYSHHAIEQAAFWEQISVLE